MKNKFNDVLTDLEQTAAALEIHTLRLKNGSAPEDNLRAVSSLAAHLTAIPGQLLAMDVMERPKFEFKVITPAERFPNPPALTAKQLQTVADAFSALINETRVSPAVDKRQLVDITQGAWLGKVSTADPKLTDATLLGSGCESVLAAFEWEGWHVRYDYGFFNTQGGGKKITFAKFEFIL